MSRSRQDWPRLSPLVTLAAVVLVLYFARAILIPLALALTLNFLLTPLVMFFQRFRMRRGPAVALAVLISGLFVGTVGWVVSQQLLQVANDLPKYRANIHSKIQALHYPPDSALIRATQSLEEIGKEFSDRTSSEMPAIDSSGLPTNTGQAGTDSRSARPLPVQLVTVPATGLPYMREVLGPALVPLAMAGMVLIFTVFILIEQEDLRDRFLRLAGVGQLHTMTLALDDASRRISR